MPKLADRRCFVPASQYPDIPGGDPVVTISTVGDASDLAPVLRAFVRDLDSTLALGPILSMEDRLLDRLSRPRLYSTVLAAFAGITLLVAAVGLLRCAFLFRDAALAGDRRSRGAWPPHLHASFDRSSPRALA
jgi:hypothetical protein